MALRVDFHVRDRDVGGDVFEDYFERDGRNGDGSFRRRPALPQPGRDLGVLDTSFVELRPFGIVGWCTPAACGLVQRACWRPLARTVAGGIFPVLADLPAIPALAGLPLATIAPKDLKKAKSLQSQRKIMAAINPRPFCGNRYFSC